MKSIAGLALLSLCATTSAAAQDPVKVDSKHYQVLFEDADIRVLRITYGAREKSVMHEHPAGQCVVILTDGQLRATTPDGKSSDGTPKTGEVNCSAPGPVPEKHNMENLGSATFSAVIVERKTKPKP
jgi:hypothetical protein